MFEKLDMAPADPILGLTEAFKKDPNPQKVNLGVGVYKSADNKTPILESVKRAEERLLKAESTKSYLPISGSPEYGMAVRRLLFGCDHEILSSGRAVTAHTPGGTGALRVAADFIKTRLSGARVWISDPTWANHAGVFEAAGLETLAYPYYDAENKCLKFDAMTEALRRVSASDVVLFHACCHNPSGMDPDPGQWVTLADIAGQVGFLPFFDFAYQGLGDGIDEDAAGLRAFSRPGAELLVASSFSKNFGLYNERVGALTLVAANADAARKSLSHLEKVIRVNYSNPPTHGASIVTTVLNDPELGRVWEGEVQEMRDRINGMRQLFVDTLKNKGVDRDFSFLTRQRGMFSFSGLTKDQVGRLRDQYAIYVVGSGRINVAGMTTDNMDYLCGAIADVLAG
ncbi:MAG TPA: amino acid aminotransferase [Candidatus Hydrogenedentes bacterium]|nr:amino acid aminotransferase [Candidatus Hydrogenedentota bacterium]HPG66358.1 amino acid aminotransferase [Candidatus Hydrogenedentota bacterium]